MPTDTSVLRQVNTIPALLIVMQPREFCGRHPAHSFWLKVDGSDSVGLDGCVTLPAARQAARELGYEATHWLDSDAESMISFGSAE